MQKLHLSNFMRFALLVFTLLLFASCGGGGGASSSPSDTKNPPAPAPEPPLPEIPEMATAFGFYTMRGPIEVLDNTPATFELDDSEPTDFFVPKAPFPKKIKVDSYLIIEGTSYRTDLEIYTRPITLENSQAPYSRVDTIKLKQGTTKNQLFFRPGRGTYQVSIRYPKYHTPGSSVYSPTAIYSFEVVNEPSYEDAEYNSGLFWCMPTAYMQPDFKWFRQMVALVTDGRSGNRDKALALYEFYIHRRGIFSKTKPTVERWYKNESAIWTLLNGGVCRNHTFLYGSLLRASGVPTRYRHGDLYIENNGTPYKLAHAWNEVFWDGAWHHVDVTQRFFDFREYDQAKEQPTWCDPDDPEDYVYENY